MKAFAESVLYKTITLSDDEAHEPLTRWLMSRLAQRDDPLAQNARDLHVESFHGDDSTLFMDIHLLQQVIHNLRHLTHFGSVSSQGGISSLLNTD